MLSRLLLCALLLAAVPVTTPALLWAQTLPVAAITVTAADIRFMQEMIGHHQQAVEMTALVAARTRRPQLQLLAERISVSQTDEVALMRQWLQKHGAASAAMTGPDAHAGHDMRAMPLMPGMLSAREMDALRAARGARFDRLFLQGMILHHEGALTMVERVRATPGAVQESSINRFVTDVSADQRAEIRRMRSMLDMK